MRLLPPAPLAATLPTALATALLVALLPAAARAQGKPLPPPSSPDVPPLEMTITMKDGKPACDPAELLVPANTNVVLHIVSQADRPVTITMPGQFSNGLVEHSDGDLVHVASEHGYLVKQNGQGTLRLRTEEPGREEYACTSTANESQPFKGSYVRKPAAN